MNPKTRRVAIVGGNRIPFARSDSTYAHASNQDMLTAALDGLVDRFGLEGETLGEVAGGAVLKHSHDRDLARESVLSTRLAAETPAYDVQQACGTGLETTILVANKIALGQIDAGIACGADTTSDAPIALNEQLRSTLLEANRQRSTTGKLRALTGFRPQHIVPSIPRNEEPRTGLSMGEHCAIMASEWEIGRAEQDELALASHQNLAAAYERGFFDDLITPYLGLARDQNLRPDSSLEKLGKLKPVFGGEQGTMTAANSTPLSDGASAVLLASEEWAKERDLPVLAYLTEAQTAAVDHVHKREGLLMAPAYAMPKMLDRAGLGLGDFDYYEIHEAFAAQVLCTLAAWEDQSFCQDKLGQDKPLGAIDRAKLNVNGGSLAAAHPFAATGGRIVAGLAKQLHEDGTGRGVISICAAGGQGVVAILEGPEVPQMSDRYSQLVNAPVVSTVAKQLGLPQPTELDRYRAGAPVVSGPVLSGAAPGGRLQKAVAALLDEIGAERAGAEGPAKALVFDATGVADSTELVELQRFFYPAVPRLQRSGRVVVLGTPPEQAGTPRAHTAQRALEGFVRSLGKEIGGRGCTAQLVLVAPGGEDQLGSTLRFLLSPRSAYVSGQVVRIGPGVSPTPELDWERPLEGRTALVTGASRGIGAAIATVLARDGAKVVGLDVPPAGEDLGRLMTELGGDSLTLDITAEDAPIRIAERFSDGLDVLVHNAGVTKDRTLAKMPEERWTQLMEINLSSEERINDALLDAGLLAEGGRIVGVSSMAGIAGNNGQTNYAASKAGVIGMVEALAPELAERGATINAVAPGFIETKMTAAMPIGPREAGRRLSSLSQGGLPVDVAETIAWFASPASTGVNGNVVRVCGQSLLGA